jgi:TetR/AcrR family transcriptional regulator, copper-responsive repressor
MSVSEPKQARGRPRKMTDDELRDMAMHAYWCADPADLSINTICERADISKPSLYRVFGSEDGLMRAALDAYAQTVLSDIFAILQSGQNLRQILDELMDFACLDERMKRGCLYYKMRMSKHRLGPLTRERVDEIDAAGKAAYERFFEARRKAGDYKGPMSPSMGAHYLGEQVALAIAQRAFGDDPARIRQMLSLALSVLH